jgi:hypothetical protein
MASVVIFSKRYKLLAHKSDPLIIHELFFDTGVLLRNFRVSLDNRHGQFNVDGLPY